MDIASVRGKAARYFHTLIYLKPEQIIFQLHYRLRRLVWFYPLESKKLLEPLVVEPLVLIPSVSKPNSYLDGIYTFLNLEKDFSCDGIDWEYTDYGKLWLYNLHYFDYLLQPSLDKQIGLHLIRQYVEALPGMKVGIEPYPTSLRGINWIKFLSLHGIRDEAIDRSLYSQYHLLSRTLEYHLLGNHLLENAFSLLFGAMYFKDRDWFEKSRKLLQRELQEQVLDDGAHFELSPMYHQILLDRLLDCVNLIQHNQRFAGQERLLGFMEEKAGKMLGWLQSMAFPNGSVPHVNDATDAIAPSSSEIEAYADRLGISIPERATLSDSGYRRYDRDAYCCIADVGAIGPDYIPGHAHADTFNFVLNVDDEPLIVDTGISTYEKGPRRDEERSTKAHNAVVVNGMNSSDVWGGFRVGKRAKTVIEEDGKHVLCAHHDGYRDQGVTHRRTWVFSGEEIEITDEVVGAPRSAEAFLHFDYRVDVSNTDGALVADGIVIDFQGAEQVELADYEQALGFNKKQGARCVRITFRDRLITRIRM